MKVNVRIKTNLKTAEAISKVKAAARLGIRDTVVEIHADSVKGSPWRTGHNRRSLAGEVSGMGVVAQGGDAAPARVVDDSKIQGAVYSTSGYGGFLETGTSKMSARPYMGPAAAKHFTPNGMAAKLRRHT